MKIFKKVFMVFAAVALFFVASETLTYVHAADTTDAKYELVTDASTLKAGDILVFGCSSKGKVSSAISGKFFSAVDATIANGVLTSKEVVGEMTLGGEAGAWTFTASEGLIGTSGAKALTTNGSGTTTWTIAIDEKGLATVASTNASYGRFLCNSSANPPRFLNYTSNSSSTMLLPEIYRKMPDVIKYDVTFDALNGTTAKVVKYEANSKLGEVEVPTRNGYKFLGWATSADSTDVIADFANVTVTANITYYAIWEEIVGYDVTFDANGGKFANDEISYTSKYEANSEINFDGVTKPTKNYAKLAGWSLTKDGAIVQTATVTANITYYAIWEALTVDEVLKDAKIDSKSQLRFDYVEAISEIENPGWNLVTDVAELNIGDKVIIAANDADVALSTTQNSNNRPTASITKNGNTLVDPNENVQVLTIEKGSADGTFAFNSGNGYLCSPSSNNYLRTQESCNDNASYTIVINDGKATIKNVALTSYDIRYNSNSNIFSSYKSGQKDVSLYKYNGEGTTYTVDSVTLTLRCSLSLADYNYLKANGLDVFKFKVSINDNEKIVDITKEEILGDVVNFYLAINNIPNTSFKTVVTVGLGTDSSYQSLGNFSVSDTITKYLAMEDDQVVMEHLGVLKFINKTYCGN